MEKNTVLRDPHYPVIRRVLALAALSAALGSCASVPRPMLANDPLTPEEHVNLALSYKKQGLAERAAAQYEAAIAKDAGYAPALIGLGNMAYEKNELGKAEKYYERAVRSDPSHPAACNNLAMVYVTEGKKLKNAEKLVRGALPQSQDLRPYLLETLASICLADGRVAESEILLDEADRIVPAENEAFHRKVAKTREKLNAAKETKVSK